MLASFVVGGLLVLSIAFGEVAEAQSRCNAGVTKAVARKVSAKAESRREGAGEGTAPRRQQTRQG